MESISIPFEVYQKLNQQYRKNDEEDGIAVHRGGAQVLLLYHKDSLSPPTPTTEEKDANNHGHEVLQKDNRPLHLFTIFSEVSVNPPLPLPTPSSPSLSPSTEIQAVHEIELHPLLEEFMIFSAMAIERSNNDREKHSSTVDTSASTLNVEGTQGSMGDQTNVGAGPLSPSSSTSPVAVQIRYEHPHDFHEDHDLHEYPYQCRASESIFYIQRPKIIHDLDLPVRCQQSIIHMELEFIHCSNEHYEQCFLSMAAMNDARTIVVNDWQNSQQSHTQNGDDPNKMSQFHRYVYQVLCQGLEYKIIKKFMILPIVLPPYPSSSSSPSYDSTYCQEEAESGVAFFKVNDICFLDDSKTTKKGDIDSAITKDEVCYRLGALTQYCETLHSNHDSENEDRSSSSCLSIRITSPRAVGIENSAFMSGKNGEEANTVNNNFNDDSTSPGYENLIQEIVSMSNISIESGSPTGVLLTGCRGVGKSRLASSLSQILSSKTSKVHVVSAKDILLEASLSIFDISALKKIIIPTTSNVMPIDTAMAQKQQHIVIIDDLDAMLDENADSDDSTAFVFDERKVALHAVLESIDEIVSDRKAHSDSDGGNRYNGGNPSLPFILGMCCLDSSRIPSVLHRVGRFEKILEMPPPTELQRREILRSMINDLPIAHCCGGIDGEGQQHIPNAASREQVVEVWSSALARTTAGCVASDLKSICINAFTRSKTRDLSSDNDLTYQTKGKRTAGVLWDDLRETARSCIPSQLAQLDVTVPRLENEHLDSTLLLNKRDSNDNFQKIWNIFGGYNEMKENVSRSILKPWRRRHYKNGDGRPISKLEMEIPPPTGILFHGASGTGKTFAAEVLARSLGLNVVKVRASDILDQWLGGSEAAIRSIFSRCRAAAPCLLLFDELDALATNREEEDSGSSDLYSRLLSTLLNEMDGVNSNSGNSGVLVVGTTNRIHAIDPALLRPGRFEKHILIERPRACDIESILKLQLAKVPFSHDVDLAKVSQLLHQLGVSGADLRSISTEACLSAIRNIGDTKDFDDMFVTMKDFEESIRLWRK